MVGGETTNSFHAQRGMQARALRAHGTQSVPGGIPTETVGTRGVWGGKRLARRTIKMKGQKRQLRKGWFLGFFGLFSFIGFQYFQTGDWLDLIWFLYLLWFIWFIPVNPE